VPHRVTGCGAASCHWVRCRIFSGLGAVPHLLRARCGAALNHRLGAVPHWIIDWVRCRIKDRVQCRIKDRVQCRIKDRWRVWVAMTASRPSWPMTKSWTLRRPRGRLDHWPRSWTLRRPRGRLILPWGLVASIACSEAWWPL